MIRIVCFLCKGKEENIGRRFYSCKLGEQQGGCKFFAWMDAATLSHADFAVQKPVSIMQRDKTGLNDTQIIIEKLELILLKFASIEDAIAQIQKTVLYRGQD